MKVFSLYFMAYSQGKFFGNMVAMDNQQWFDRVCVIPDNLKSWLHYEIDDRDSTVPYSAHHQHPPQQPIQILPNVKTVKLLQHAKDTSNTPWDIFYSADVENWQPVDHAAYTLHQDNLQSWDHTLHHLILCQEIVGININYQLAKEYFNVYWQAHSNLF